MPNSIEAAPFSPESEQAAPVESAAAPELGKITVLEALAEPSENLTPSMSWQSAWSSKEDK